MDLKTKIGIITLVIATISYSFYFLNMFRHKTKPHAISWLIWSVLNAVTFLTQRSNGAGAGGWVTGFAAIACVMIFISSLKYGEKNITRIDWLCLILALATLGIWHGQRGSSIEVVLVAATFVIGFIPTIRKSIKKPRQETSITFFLNGFKFLLAITALNTVNLATALYPIVIVVMNFGFVTLLIIRRQN